MKKAIRMKAVAKGRGQEVEGRRKKAKGRRQKAEGKGRGQEEEEGKGRLLGCFRGSIGPTSGYSYKG
jgi:ribosomal protein L12E/L44/L45/RPP1/RPP2